MAIKLWGSNSGGVKLMSEWDTWKALGLSTDTSLDWTEFTTSVSTTGTTPRYGITWQNTDTIKVIPAGTWTQHATMSRTGPAGDMRVRIRHYDASQTPLATLLTGDHSLGAGTAEYENAGNPGEITVKVGEYLSLEFRNLGASGTEDVESGANSDTSSECWIEFPDWTEVTPVDASPVDVFQTTAQMYRKYPDPICQWDTEPYQFIEQNTTFTAGIVSYCKGGVNKVVITLTPNSGSFTGSDPYTFPNVTAETINSITGWPSYNVDIPASWFTANTTFTLAAQVYNNDGTYVDASSDSDDGFEDITLYVDQDGTTVRGTAWVHTSGLCSDTSGIVAYGGSKPAVKQDWYATAADAIEQLKAWMLANAGSSIVDGCVVYLSDETHTYARNDNTLHSNSYAWLTITHENSVTGDVDATPIINGAPGVTCPYVPYTNIEGNITIGPTAATILSMTVGTNLWRFKDCTIIGASRTDYGPIWDTLATKDGTRIYLNSCTMSSMRWLFDGSKSTCEVWALGNTMSVYMDDVVCNCRFLYGNFVADTDPVGSGAHSDINKISDVSGSAAINPVNVIFAYNKILGTKFQGFFIRGEAIGDMFNKLRRWACVNNYIETDAHPFKLVANIDHFVVWNNLFKPPDSVANGLMNTDNAWGQSFTGRVFIGCTKWANNQTHREFGNLSFKGNLIEGSFFFRGRNYTWPPPNYTDDVSDEYANFNVYVDETAFDYNNYYCRWDEFTETGSQTPGTNVTTEDPLVDATLKPHNPSIFGVFAAPVKYDLDLNVRPALATLGPYEGVPVVPKDIQHRDYRKRKTTECPF